MYTVFQLLGLMDMLQIGQQCCRPLAVGAPRGGELSRKSGLVVARHEQMASIVESGCDLTYYLNLFFFVLCVCRLCYSLPLVFLVDPSISGVYTYAYEFHFSCTLVHVMTHHTQCMSIRLITPEYCLVSSDFFYPFRYD